jgi:hypothetical protein
LRPAPGNPIGRRQLLILFVGRVISRSAGIWRKNMLDALIRMTAVAALAAWFAPR